MCNKYVCTFDQLWRANDVVINMFPLSLRPTAPGLVCVQVRHAVLSMKQDGNKI